VFSEIAFRQYLLKNADASKANKIALEALIAAISDFSKTPDKTLSISSSSSSYYIKKVFYKVLSDKPRSVGVQKYLLNTFGYQKCYRCNLVLSLNSYNKKADRWNLLDNECKDCSNNRYNNYRLNNLDKELARDKIYKQQNKESISISRKIRYDNNRETEIKKARDWQRLNSDKVNNTQAKRRASKIKATPKWLTANDFLKIADFYNKAKQLEQDTGIKHHVDHIVPLKGTTVCGLHVPWNLQILTASINISKSNSYNDW
jgi:hypothetical protein